MLEIKKYFFYVLTAETKKSIGIHLLETTDILLSVFLDIYNQNQAKRWALSHENPQYNCPYGRLFASEAGLCRHLDWHPWPPTSRARLLRLESTWNWRISALNHYTLRISTPGRQIHRSAIDSEVLIPIPKLLRSRIMNGFLWSSCRVDFN